MVMFEVAMAIISTFAWMLVFIFMIAVLLYGLISVVFAFALVECVYAWLNPGKEE